MPTRSQGGAPKLRYIILFTNEIEKKFLCEGELGGTKLTPVSCGPTRWSILSLMTSQIKHTQRQTFFSLSVCPSVPIYAHTYKI
jgi:hypothetical protein